MTVPFHSSSGNAAAERLDKLARLHLWALAGAVALIALAAWRVPELALVPLLLTVAVLALANLTLALFLRQRGALPLPDGAATALTHAQIALDVVGMTLLLYFSGGSENPFFPFYVFPVILAAALLNRRAAFIYALASALLYGLMLVGETSGWLPHQHLIGLHYPGRVGNNTLLAAQWLALLATVLLAAAATALLMEALHAQAVELASRCSRW